MSLYDDLNLSPARDGADGSAGRPHDEDTSRARSHAQSLTLLHEHNLLHAKRLNAKRSHERTRPVRPAPKAEATPIAHFAYLEEPTVHSERGLLGGHWNTGDEYDPLWPNDYEACVKKAENKSRSLLGPDYDSNDESDDGQRPDGPTGPEPRGATIAPPPALMETPTESEAFSSVAKQIMRKMGYKEGQGLGRDEQGMARALHVEQHVAPGKKAMGKIVEPEVRPEVKPEVKPEPEPEVEESEESITQLLKKPTKRVLLRNLVAKGEVDEELEQEVHDECQKYGQVSNVRVHEDTDTVRVLVEFTRVEAAIKAVVDMNGRFFGGRSVKATFA